MADASHDYLEFADRVIRHRRTDRRCVVTLSSTPSTHSLMRRLVAEYSRDAVRPPICDLVAWEQTGGIGRNGRSWSSPAGGGVWASAARPVESPTTLQTLPLLVAVALAEALDRHLDGRCGLKWPNDLQVDGRKVAGILIDTISRRDDGPVLAILSFGVNVDPALDRFAIESATSVGHETSGAVPPLHDLAVELLETLDARLAAPGELVSAYRSKIVHQAGDKLTCRLADDTIVDGTFDGLDDHGHLRLDVDGETRTITAAEVFRG